jgi:hypothetical protein
VPETLPWWVKPTGFEAGYSPSAIAEGKKIRWICTSIPPIHLYSVVPDKLGTGTAVALDAIR